MPNKEPFSAGELRQVSVETPLEHAYALIQKQTQELSNLRQLNTTLAEAVGRMSISAAGPDVVTGHGGRFNNLHNLDVCVTKGFEARIQLLESRLESLDRSFIQMTDYLDSSLCGLQQRVGLLESQSVPAPAIQWTEIKNAVSWGQPAPAFASNVDLDLGDTISPLGTTPGLLGRRDKEVKILENNSTPVLDDDMPF